MTVSCTLSRHDSELSLKLGKLQVDDQQWQDADGHKRGRTIVGPNLAAGAEDAKRQDTWTPRRHSGAWNAAQPVLCSRGTELRKHELDDTGVPAPWSRSAQNGVRPPWSLILSCSVELHTRGSVRARIQFSSRARALGMTTQLPVVTWRGRTTSTSS